MEKECENWEHIYKMRMTVVATRRLGSGEGISGIVTVNDDEEFLAVEELPGGRTILLIPEENLVVDAINIIYHPELYELRREKNSPAYVAVYRAKEKED